MQAVVRNKLTLPRDVPLKMAAGPLTRHLGRQVKGSTDVRAGHALLQPLPCGVEGVGEAALTVVARVEPGGQPSPTLMEGIIAPKGEGEHREEALLPKEALSRLNHTCHKGGMAEIKAGPESTSMQARREPDASDDEGVVKHARQSNRLRRPTKLEVDEGGRLLSIRRGDVAEPVVEQGLEAVEHYRPQVSGVGLELIDD